MISAMKYQDRIVRDPQIVVGEPVPEGYARHAEDCARQPRRGCDDGGDSRRLPTLTEEDVRAAIVFATASAQEDLPLAETPIKR
jgi:uncharacterized protein (DUF433 family)